MNKSDRFSDPRHIRWARSVKKRDGYRCQICKRTGVYLNAHHMNSYGAYEDQRFSLFNGVTLCSRCHKDFHDTYGYGKNTYVQFEEFKKVAESIREAVLKSYG